MSTYGSAPVDCIQLPATLSAQAETEASWCAFAEVAPFILWILDPQGRCTYVNRAWTNFTGRAAEAELGFGWMDVLHPDDLERGRQALQAAVQAQTAYRIELRMRRCDNQYRHMLETGYPRLDASGRLTGYIGTTQDVTELRDSLIQAEHSQQALRIQKERYQAVLEATQDGIWDWDHVSGQTFWSERLYELVGISPETPVDGLKPLMQHLHPDDAGRVQVELEHRLAQCEPFELEVRLTPQGDAPPRVLRLVGRCLHDESGRRVRLSGSAQDITEKRRIELAFQQSEAKFQQIFESQLIGMMLWKLDGVITDANDVLLNLLGYAREDLRAGRLSLSTLTPSEYQSKDSAAIQELRAQGVKAPYEKQLLTRDGRRLDVYFGMALLPGDHPEAVAFVMDVTELKRAQGNLAAYAKKLELSNRDLEQFATVASHDLQEPLRKVHMFSEMVLKAKSEEERRNYADRMHSAIQRMQALIGDLLTLSRVNRHGQPFELVSLHQVLANVLTDLEVLIREKSARVTVVGSLATVDADPRQIEQVFLNLIANALKFHRDDLPPEITITGKALDDHTYQVSVSDCGIGFDPTDSERIFMPFERLHNRAKYPGTGIGLSICRKIIERHDGTIQATGQSGVGATFTFTLPRLHPAQH
jgi:PAS domain S-box-containing protein